MCGAYGAKIAAELRDARATITRLREELARLSSRDGNAKIQLCYDDGYNPFHKEELSIVDFGVSDNVYVVEKSI